MMGNKLPLALLVPLLLAGCGGGALVVDGGTRTLTNTVSVPIGVPCYTNETLPEKPAVAKVDDKNATTDQLSAASAANAEVFSAYADAADKLLRQCVRSTAKGGSNVVVKPLAK